MGNRGVERGVWAVGRFGLGTRGVGKNDGCEWSEVEVRTDSTKAV
jgi:hypothetical protein